MLIAIIGMKHFGVSANLMSLGAIDFGLIVDAAVIIIENCVRQLAVRKQELKRRLEKGERIATIRSAILEVRKASQFGELVIIAAYLPILSLTGIGGKMFRPMALTVMFALAGALILSLTLIPALAALFLREPKHDKKSPEENPVVRFLSRVYEKGLLFSVARPSAVWAGVALLVVLSGLLATGLGSEFIPDLNEGAIAINTGRLPSVSLNQSVKMISMMERSLMEEEEVETVTTRIGRPEIATDPMGRNTRHVRLSKAEVAVEECA